MTLHIDRVRNLRSVKVEGLQKTNVFFGANGSGKTSILESVHLLGMARSFRGNSIRSLITHDEPHCTAYGMSRRPNTPGKTPLGVQRARSGGAHIKIGGQDVRTVAELAEYLPLQVVTADTFGLLTGPPGGRRQYMDWGVFHVEHRFFEEWRRFQRCIKQRNMLLRRGKLPAEELSVWTRELALSGEVITNFRKLYFEALIPKFHSTMKQLAPTLGSLDLSFRPGWAGDEGLANALEQSLKADSEQGYTHVGPQRADIRVTSEGHLAADTLSRGQQKLVVCGLKLAQGQLMADMGRGQCTYLIDDLPSELDEEHSRLVCQLLAEMEAQVFITCVDQEEILSVWPKDEGLAMFHVKHGEVEKLNSLSGGGNVSAQ